MRESLEEQTQVLARAVEHLRYPNGEPVECVVAEPCIGGVAEAAATEDLFRRENVGVSLTVTPCWCYGSETMDMDPLRPKAVWGFNGTERPGAVYLAAVLAEVFGWVCPLYATETIFGPMASEGADGEWVGVPGGETSGSR